MLGAECDNPLVEDMKTFGFRPEEFVPTAWELIPYSFVVDYFTNVNDIINAWAYRSAGIEWLQYTAYRESEVKTTLHDDSARFCASQGFAYKASGGAGGCPRYCRRDVMRMRVAPSSLVPNFQFKVPGMPQFVNLVALITSHKLTVPF